MKQSELANIIRKYHSEALKDLKIWEEKYEQAKHRKYVKDYYWASSREWVLNELACELGVELYNEDFELIGEEA